MLGNLGIFFLAAFLKFLDVLLFGYIANNCKRLIQNAVILWNYLYIEKKLKEVKSEMQKDEIIEAIKNSSIIHWSHINFYGTYDFTKIDKKVNAMIN